MPFNTAMNLGAEVESVAVSFIKPEEVVTTLEALMPRLGFNLYAGTGGVIMKWSAIGRTSIAGMSDIVIPILIAALIVLNTMLGAVYERVKEIHIFSSIGLAPNHIATLFMAESFVYAILGAIFGYLIGQGLAKVITIFGILPGLYLNYSSVSAVASTSVVIGVVLLSTLYPARKASEVATPAIERRWQVPDPVGDNWDIPLPFAVTGDQATALTRFMVEWFEAYEEYSIGDFVTQRREYSHRRQASTACPSHPPDGLGGAVRPGCQPEGATAYHPDRHGGRVRDHAPSGAGQRRRLVLAAGQPPVPEYAAQAVPDLAHAARRGARPLPRDDPGGGSGWRRRRLRLAGRAQSPSAGVLSPIQNP